MSCCNLFERLFLHNVDEKSLSFYKITWWQSALACDYSVWKIIPLLLGRAFILNYISWNERTLKCLQVKWLLENCFCLFFGAKIILSWSWSITERFFKHCRKTLHMPQSFFRDSLGVKSNHHQRNKIFIVSAAHIVRQQQRAIMKTNFINLLETPHELTHKCFNARSISEKPPPIKQN